MMQRAWLVFGLTACCAWGAESPPHDGSPQVILHCDFDTDAWLQQWGLAKAAPSPGITIIKGGIGIQTHDVILQHLRVRPGEAGAAKKSGWEVDALATSGAAHDVVIDHCSTSWATDENLSASGERFSGATVEEWRKGIRHDRSN